MQPEGIYQEIFDQLHDGVYFVDSERRIVHWNAAAEQITGFSAEEVVGRLCHENILRHVDVVGTELCLNGCPLHSTISDRVGRSVELVYLHHKEGHRVPIHVHTLPLVQNDGSVDGAVEIFSVRGPGGADLQRRIADLKKRLMLDQLTQLSNREHAEHFIETKLFSLRNGGNDFGILFIDIDHFKNLNDTYGHDVGDQALKVVAGTLRNNIRPTDIIARWGGEEFVGVFEGIDLDGLKSVAVKLTMLVRSSRLEINGESIRCTISSGATVANEDDDVKSLVKRADVLMYQSKADGRDRVTAG